MAAPVPTKVFVGNLSFKTRDADLLAAFETVGKVATANIITRGPRSLGYGFVEFVNNDDAEKAIGKLNKTELDGRQINVEIAKPREQTEGASNAGDQSTAGARPPRARRPRKPRAAAGTSAVPATTGATAAPTGDQASPSADAAPAAARRPRRQRKPRSPGGSSGAQTTGAAPSTQQQSGAGASDGAGVQDGRRPVRRRRFGRFSRSLRQKTDEQPRVASTTTLFVANLPYQVDNAGLAEIFKEFNPVKAYVVQTHSGHSRGFGFVEFANETDQQNALKNVDKKIVQDRPLSVKVSQVRETPAGADAAPAAQ